MPLPIPVKMTTHSNRNCPPIPVKVTSDRSDATLAYDFVL